jgi:hypothetical protein
MSDEDTTRIIKRGSVVSDETLVTSPIGSRTSTIKSDDDPHTKIFRPSKAGPSGADISSAASDFSAEPVAGWLVVVDGPGRGQALKLGFGMNSIGRDSDQRVSLDYGDEEISRKSHALLTFDPKGNKFYVQHGGGINLTYIDDQPILQTQELKGRELICIGITKLCFVPFCGPDFKW